MKYDFTTVYDRRGMDALAVDALGQPGGFAPGKPKDGFSIIPMWVADMNFATVPTIPAAIIERAQHPLYGYFATPDTYYQAIIAWQRDRNGVTDLPKEAIGYENGVLGGVMSALGCLAAPGDAVLVHSPTYIGFTRTLESNGYRIIHSPLHRDENGVWRMDFDDMDRLLKQHHIHAAIFCSPTTPAAVCGSAGRSSARWKSTAPTM